jgi:hypothetical protein
VVALALAAAAIVSGCDTNGTPCYPGDIVPCACAGGGNGLSVCAATGAGYGACSQPCTCAGGANGLSVCAATGAGAGVCNCGDAGTVVDAAPDVADAGLPFGATCAKDADCASGVCFTGNMRAFCSMHCATPQDCPNPPTSGTCNARGFCK